MKRLVILGSGGHGKVIADTAEQQGLWSEVVFADLTYPNTKLVHHWPIVAADLIDLNPSDCDLIVGIGNNQTRLAKFQEAKTRGFSLCSVIHPSAYISPHSQVGLGSVVFANAVINIGANIGAACIVNTGATVDHDCVLGDGVHISPGANLAGDVQVDACSWVGIGACVKQGISIGSGSMVGAGASVVRDVADQTVVVGVPANTNT